MKILGIEHIGIAVNSIDKDAPFWKHVLNIPHRRTEVVSDQGVTTDIYDTGQGKVELLEALGADTPIGKYLEKRGPGVHHVCFEVDNITKAIQELKESKIQVLSNSPTTGAEGYKVVFIHPKSTGGVLVELAEKPK
ncbi:MAG: methylmalonyl-CoA epimerase [Candidatus Marinimicrobia bacterium]|nr:methylmalonyl-CoA epimerase [Candidatus Neomarinimicrobiota bacterium]MBT3676632.1 methylmalonyl-CoA epimerase [Candidatus Neomarinimicrobiota bacterium]MBT3763585.1 methylmalonyl-CoA epimerase [Candidatus Neomarinimicrobiota bacterium]MBT4069374.1 methylmalonyl-CoA epimerase [Candidatus Neomarinimicrobiota bacterium]MBT4271002.1 methylmalonyl-CoA epimerase [Candidatus Neomarinimicrobiota bacterium]